MNSPAAMTDVHLPCSAMPVAPAERYGTDHQLESDPLAPALPPKADLDDFRRFDPPQSSPQSTPRTRSEERANSPGFPARVASELARARELHPDPHVAVMDSFAVLRKQWFDYEGVIFVTGGVNAARLRRELVQLAAMCQRAAEDLHLVTVGS